MNLNNYTIKAQEVVQSALQIATDRQQLALEPGHLLQALLQADEHVLDFLLKKLSVHRPTLQDKLTAILDAYPKASGQQPYLSQDTHTALQKATAQLKDFQDEFVAIEHLLLGLAAGTDKVGTLMREVGLVAKALVKAIRELRGNSRVTDANAEAKYRSLARYSKNLNELAKAGKIDPVIGRDEEIRRVLQIISRRTKNNPLYNGGFAYARLAE
ncbi:MAG: Clp protease N-terminal domain-containing protein [Bacteroidota bacterium]